MRCKLAIAAVLVMLAGVVGPAHALGFGDIRVESALNQPLRASFPLLGVKPEEQDEIVVRVASRAAFERFGIERVGLLDEVELALSEGAETGRLLVRMRSTRSVREPFLTFLVEATWSGRRALREYTILLDPPTSAPAARAPAEAAPSVPAGAEFDTAATPQPESQPEVDTGPSQPADDEPVARVEPEAPTDGEPAGDSDAGPAADGPRRIGPVQADQTLWRLASNNRPAGSVTMDQMLVALYRSNPQAFDGNMNLMLKGATLLVPSLEDIRAISRREATQLVADQRRAFEQLGGSSSQTRVADSGGQTSNGGSAGELRLEAAEESAGDDASATRVATSNDDGAGDTGEALGALAANAAADDNGDAARDESAAGNDDAATNQKTNATDDAAPAQRAVNGDVTANGAEAGDSRNSDGTADAVADDKTADGEADTANPSTTESDNGEATDEPADGDMVAGLDAGADDATGGEAASAADGRNETGADGNADPGATVTNAETGNDTTGDATAEADDGSESDAAKPITPVESVVPDSAAGLFTARQLLLALAGLLLVVALFAYLRRRQYKPVPADFSGLDQDEPAVATAATPAPATAAAAPVPESVPEPAPDVEEVLADARFHEENELYDEALSVLAMGREHHPHDPRLQDRTLAVLHAAGERDTFIAEARNIFPRPDPDDERWREAAAMGRELAPDEDLFVDVPLPASQQVPATVETDLAANTRVAGEPADGLSEPVDSPQSWLTPAAAAAPEPAAADDRTDDDLTPSTDEEFEAMLASFDAGDAPGSAAEPARREPESVPAPHTGEAGIDLDPDQFDFEVESGSTVQPAAGDDAMSSDPLAFDIGDLSVGDAGQDEIATSSDEPWLGETGETDREAPEAAEGGLDELADPFADSDVASPAAADRDRLDDGLGATAGSASAFDDGGLSFEAPDVAGEQPDVAPREPDQPAADDPAALDIDLDEDWRPAATPVPGGASGAADGGDAPTWSGDDDLSLSEEPAWPESATPDTTAGQLDAPTADSDTVPGDESFRLDDEFDLDTPTDGTGAEAAFDEDATPTGFDDETPDPADGAEDPFATAPATETESPATLTPDFGDTVSPDDTAGPIDDDMGLDAPADESGGEDLAIQLDLARAYLDMGEPDMAGSLLEEVRDQGTADQRREAEDLLKRL
ncbi:FimV/HubP family polar landmark protein [Salinisphaera sp. P385]|uniref:FimV/HubP family polar landmark protein n=1 Tax=Spectribacter acetivorans TaxID=3075603 RepID=A0ABU3B3A6_9GAMM|nr:FimV/HubP family polar landmark protein [Salinisphaera sp. P385]MDT0616943.1 FimV/HubP family polar landmark protein [Salinisphaera sp. P385]